MNENIEMNAFYISYNPIDKLWYAPKKKEANLRLMQTKKEGASDLTKSFESFKNTER